MSSNVGAFKQFGCLVAQSTDCTIIEFEPTIIILQTLIVLAVKDELTKLYINQASLRLLIPFSSFSPVNRGGGVPDFVFSSRHMKSTSKVGWNWCDAADIDK